MEERTLYQTLADAPDDDGPRVVFADWLLERGDPMAEFLALQLEHHHKPLDTLRAQRAQDLLIMNWRRWVGPLHRVLHRRACLFERGFLREVELMLRPSSEPLREALQWATVRTLSANDSHPDTLGALLTSPWLRNLNQLSCRAHAISGHRDCAFRLHTLHLGGSVANVEPNAAWDQLQLLTLHELGGTLSSLKLSARELHCEAIELEHALTLARDALELPRRPERVVVQFDGCEFVLTHGSDLIKGETTLLDPQDLRTIRRFGSLELELTSGLRRYRGPAKGLDWR